MAKCVKTGIESEFNKNDFVMPVKSEKKKI